jgi:hypothetical protein
MSDMADNLTWTLDGTRINDLQARSIRALIETCKAAHFTDVRVRINGEWRTFQADWIKHLVEATKGRAPDTRGVSEP